MPPINQGQAPQPGRGRKRRIADIHHHDPGGAPERHHETQDDAQVPMYQEQPPHSPPFKHRSGRIYDMVRLNPGIASALIAALLFGASTPLAKLLLHDVSPLLLAGLLYAGSGLGLLLVLALRALRSGHSASGPSGSSMRRPSAAHLGWWA